LLVPARRRPPGQRTFTELARRKQIVDAAIQTIAEAGYARASFARIANRAGLSSTGLITYHFADRDDLMQEVVAEVLRTFTTFVSPRVDAQTSAAAKLRAFIESNVAFMRANRPAMVALAEVLRHARTTDALRSTQLEFDLTRMQELLRRGQADGEFRDFDPRLMAVAIRSLRDGLLDQLARHPELELDTAGRELALTVELMTRRN